MRKLMSWCLAAVMLTGILCAFPVLSGCGEKTQSVKFRVYHPETGKEVKIQDRVARITVQYDGTPKLPMVKLRHKGKSDVSLYQYVDVDIKVYDPEEGEVECKKIVEKGNYKINYDFNPDHNVDFYHNYIIVLFYVV